MTQTPLLRASADASTNACTGASDPSPFVHLHVHSNFSFLDGGSRIEEFVARAASLGQTALALTDHDGLYGAVRFAKACAKHKVKPIFGAELRVESLLRAGRGRGADAGSAPQRGAGASGTARPPGDDPHHLVLLAETREGYANLCRLISAAHLADPERARPPQVTLDSLSTHAQGLICLTGCRHGEVGWLIDSGRDQEARTALLALHEIFGPHNLYVELQYFGYQPHQQAYAGQHGATVYHKAPAVGGRLRHQPTESLQSGPPTAAPGGAMAPGGAATTARAGASCWSTEAPPSSIRSRADHPPTPPPPPSPPELLAGNAADHYPTLHTAASTTLVAYWRSSTATTNASSGSPCRLNPADYDVGFHRDGRPWRLSCLTYCERLVRLADACDLPTVLTTNAHYAGPEDLALHLVVRAAGRDQPLSGYPEPVAGQRCLRPEVELQDAVRPLLELLGQVDPWDWLPDWCADWAPADYGIMQNYSSATTIATCGGGSPLANTVAIAARCNVDLDLGTFHFPRVEVPPGETAYSLLAQRCFRGVARRYRPVSPEAMALLEKELRMIQHMGFAHYFLVVHDIVRWARAQGIACSGRGSAGNSIVCHALDITASDPIRHHLLFERFLNPNRREMPDIDVDFCSSRRDEVIDHIYKTFGDQNVAVVANVNTMSPRSAVRTVAEALGFAPSEINTLAANVPHHGDAARIRDYLAGEWPELRDSPLQDGAHAEPAPPAAGETVHALSKRICETQRFLRTHSCTKSCTDACTEKAPRLAYAFSSHVGKSTAPTGTGPPARRSPPPAPPPAAATRSEGRYARFLDLVERLDGFPLHLGTHLGGFVIADRPITYYAPLQWAAKGIAVVQFNKDDVAALGLVKMDILGLRTHSAVSECVHIIRQRTGRRIRPYELPPDDRAAYEIISNGGSIGLFQLESAGQRNLASRLQERDFDDVIAAIALYRPGPLEAEMIGPFIDRRWGLEPVSLPHPAMAEAVADTYGVILYQEQVLRIAQAVAGFDLADADSLRRAMTRDRSREDMAKIGEIFVARAVARGVPEAAAREVFRQLEGFAAYGFNKSHSVCFAVISYATAWLKAHYPAEFLCAVLNNQPMGFYTPRVVLNDARRFGLEVRPLDVNLSGRGFTVEDAVSPDPGGATLGDADPHGAARARGPYDPFTQAWTAGHAWGLTEADLVELAAEHYGAGTGANRRDALVCVPPETVCEIPRFLRTEDCTELCTEESTEEAQRFAHGFSKDIEESSNVYAAHGAAPGEAPLGAVRRGDLLLPRAPRARGGVEPGACLAPDGGIAPDAGRALRVGLSFLKQMGERSLDRIEQERRHGPFASFEDFYLRTRVDYPVAENLIRVGAFDSLEPDRTELLWRLPLLHDRLEALSGSSGQRRGQLRAFFSPPSRTGLRRVWTREDKVRAELDLLGLTVSCHPLDLYEEELRRMDVRMSYELPGLGDEVPVTVAGVYERAQNPWMRSGKRTMFLTLEDAYGLYECVCFESKLAQIAPVVARASYFLVRGRLQNNHKRGLAIVAEEVRDLEEVLGHGRAAKRAAQAGPRAAARAGTAPGPRVIPKKVG